MVVVVGLLLLFVFLWLHCCCSLCGGAGGKKGWCVSVNFSIIVWMFL